LAPFDYSVNPTEVSFLEAILDEIARKMSELDKVQLKELVRNALDEGIQAAKVLNALNKGMESVGQKYESFEYFLSELIFAGEIMKDLVKTLEPHLAAYNFESKGTLVVGTVQGDVHDLGKNIFVFLAKSAGFTVLDLGVDVSPERFVEKVREEKPQILGMSALMSTTQGYMGETMQALRKAGIRDDIKVILGGAVASQRYSKEIGADEAVNDAVLGVEICKKWIEPSE